MRRNKIVYQYRGHIEVGTGKSGYRWTNGFSEQLTDGSIPYPWLTYRECQDDAASRDSGAVFVDENGKPWSH